MTMPYLDAPTARSSIQVTDRARLHSAGGALKPRTRIVDGSQLTASDIDAWSGVLRKALPLGNAFFSPFFTQAAATAFGRVEVCLVEENGELSAIFPYQFPSGFSALMRAAVRVGEELNDRFGIIANADFRLQPNEILRLARLNYLYFTHMHERQVGHGLQGEVVQPGLKILLPSGGADYWTEVEARNPKFAKDTQRRERRAVEDMGELRFVFDEPDRETLLQLLLERKRDQYLRTGHGDWLAAPGRTEFVKLLSQTREADCSGTLSTLFFGDTWAAMHFGLRSARTLHYWFPVYNPELAHYAPGRLLLRQIILNAESSGIEVIDRGTGESRAKMDFPAERQNYYAGVWHRQGVRGYAYRAYQSARWRLNRQTQASPKTATPVAAE